MDEPDATVVAGSRREVSLESRRVAALLGLGILTERRPCHGYQNGCMCDACLDRAGRYAVLAERYGPHVAAEMAAEDSEAA